MSIGLDIHAVCYDSVVFNFGQSWSVIELQPIHYFGFVVNSEYLIQKDLYSTNIRNRIPEGRTIIKKTEIASPQTICLHSKGRYFAHQL